MTSFSVKAFRKPPTRSTSRAIWKALRRSVPLKSMCSRKCEKPASPLASSREPRTFQSPTETTSVCRTGSRITWARESRRAVRIKGYLRWESGLPSPRGLPSPLGPPSRLPPPGRS